MTSTLPATLPKAVSTAQQQNILNIVRRAARAEIMPRFRALTDGDVTTKTGPGDLVTAADTAAEAMMTRALRIAFPGALVVGEESAAADPTLLGQIADAPLAFILDPVDGTWNFAHGLAMFGVILAVTQFGRPAFGLIYDPVTDDWILADDESDALMIRPGAAPRRVQASTGKDLSQMTGHIHLHMFKGEKLAKLCATLPQFATTESLRCSAHEYRMVAQGHSDFLLAQSLNPWDHAAGVLICERAGAYAELLEGGAYDAGRHEGTLLVAPDRPTWNRMKKELAFLVED